MIRLEPFRAEHAAMLVDPETEPGLAKTIAARSPYWRLLETAGTAFSAFDGGEFLGCAGIAIVWPGVAEGFVWAQSGVHRVPLEIHHLVRRGIRYLEEKYDLRRLSVEVRQDNERGVRWVRALGFHYECDMEKRGPDGSTHMLFARIRR